MCVCALRQLEAARAKIFERVQYPPPPPLIDNPRLDEQKIAYLEKVGFEPRSPSAVSFGTVSVSALNVVFGFWFLVWFLFVWFGLVRFGWVWVYIKYLVYIFRAPIYFCPLFSSPRKKKNCKYATLSQKRMLFCFVSCASEEATQCCALFCCSAYCIGRVRFFTVGTEYGPISRVAGGITPSPLLFARVCVTGGEWPQAGPLVLPRFNCPAVCTPK